MRRNLLSILLALAGLLPVNAQYTFTFNVSWSGNCSGYTAQMNQAIRGFQTQTINGFPTRELCEQTRAMCHQELGHIELVYIDTQTGRVVKREATNCKLNVTTTPCTGRPMAGTVGTLNALGVSQGTSFYSANSANEIQNWSSDDMERMLTLNANRPFEQEQFVPIADSKYKSALVELNGKTYFRSLNIDEQGGMLTSSPDIDVKDTAWDFLKSTKKLPYQSIDEFVEGTTLQISSTQNDILELANMPLEDFRYNISQCAYEIEGWYNSESINLSTELFNAEKLHDIADFMLQYKGYLAITYINGMSDNPTAVDEATRKAFGKTRNELAYESIEKLEQDLLTKYGMGKDDIAKLKKVIDDDNKVQEYVSKAKGLALDEIGQKGVETFSEKMTDKGFNIDFGHGEVSISKALDLGVLLNNDIALLGLSQNEKALANYVQSVKDRQTKIKEIRDQETQKIGDLLSIVDNNSKEIKLSVSKKSQRDKMEWANTTDDTLGRIKKNGQKDSYGIFPDRFRNRYIKEGTYIEYRGN